MLYFTIHPFLISDLFLFLPSLPPWLIPSSCNCSSTFQDQLKSNITSSILLAHFLAHISNNSSSTHICTWVQTWVLVLVFFPSHTYNFPLLLESAELYAILFALKCMSSFFYSSFTIFTPQLDVTHTVHTPYQSVRLKISCFICLHNRKQLSFAGSPAMNKQIP